MDNLRIETMDLLAIGGEMVFPAMLMAFPPIHLRARDRQLVKTIDVTSREVERATEQMVFLIYSDGSVQKRILGDRE